MDFLFNNLSHPEIAIHKKAPIFVAMIYSIKFTSKSGQRALSFSHRRLLRQ
jgi:hypothetical protein